MEDRALPGGNSGAGALTRRILVTGGAGFLGSHLCERLLRDGNDVLCVDNFFTGRKDNLADLLGNPHFELMRHDVTFPLYVEVDEIYNLACPASPVHYQFDPVQTTKTSVHGAINMLGLAKRTKAKILQASTSEVYGDPDGASADGGLLGQRQPDRAARLLRRRQALRRDAVLRLSPPARNCAIKVVAHLQHLRAAHAPERRPRGVQLHRAGAARRGRSRSTATAARRAPSATSTTWSTGSSADGHGGRRNRPDQSRQPARNSGAGAGRADHQAYGLALAHRAPAAAGRRPDAALPGHRAGEAPLGWEPKVPLEDGLKRTIGYFERTLTAGRAVPTAG